MDKAVACDVTGERVSLSEGILVADTYTGEWFFTCLDASDRVPNKMRLDGAERVTSQTDFIDVLNGLSKKAWFSPEKFFEKIKNL